MRTPASAGVFFCPEGKRLPEYGSVVFEKYFAGLVYIGRATF